MHDKVAFMSLEEVMPSIRQEFPERKPEMSARCAMLFDGGILTVPQSRDGVIEILSMLNVPFLDLFNDDLADFLRQN